MVEAEPYEIVSTIQSLNNDFLTCADVRVNTDKDPDLALLKQYIKTGCPDRILNPTLSKIKSIIPDLSISKGCIMYQNRVFSSSALRARVLDLFHENHPGVVSMKSLARSIIWYPGMDKDINVLVNNCKICQTVRAKPAKSNIAWPTPSRVWSRIHVDHFFVDNSTCFLIIDALSKYIEVEVVSSTSTNVTIEVLSAVFARNGLPDELVSDNATSFTSSEFSSFLSRNGIKHTTSPPYQPSSNGQAERGVQVIKSMLKKTHSGKSLKYRLSQVLLQYRSVPHSITLIAPSVSLNKRKLITLKDKINPHFHSECADKEITVHQFDLGASVLALNLREGPKWYDATVTEKLGINVYHVYVHQLKSTWKRHANQLLSVPSSLRTNDVSKYIPFEDATTSNTSIPIPRKRQPPDRLMYQ